MVHSQLSSRSRNRNVIEQFRLVGHQQQEQRQSAAAVRTKKDFYFGSSYCPRLVLLLVSLTWFVAFVLYSWPSDVNILLNDDLDRFNNFLREKNGHVLLEGNTPPLQAISSAPVRLEQVPKHSSLLHTAQRTKEFVHVCLKESCLMQAGRQISRNFLDRSIGKSSWCVKTSPSVHSNSSSLFDSEGSINEPGGLILVKVPKAASSTCAGLILRIAHHSSCNIVRYHHHEGWFYKNMTVGTSKKGTSGEPVLESDKTSQNTVSLANKDYFLIGSMREPGARTYSSAWFFMLAPLNITPTDENVIRALNTRRGGGKTKGKGGYQYNYLSIEPVEPKSVWDPEHPTEVRNPPSELYSKIRQLLLTYDFIIVVERMEESVVALALLMGIPLSHVLVANAKVAAVVGTTRDASVGTATDLRQTLSTAVHDNDGGYILSRFGRKKGKCIRPGTQPMSPGVQEFLKSPTWVAMNYADEVLYRAANDSLDKTISQTIGTARFQQALQEYRYLRSFVQQYCGQRIGSGCSSIGVPVEPVELCYDRDFGCGYECIDEAVTASERQQK